MSTAWIRVLLATAAVGLAAPELSAQAAASVPAEQAEPRPKKRASRDLITREQIDAAAQKNVLSLIQALNPTWLSTRGAVSFARPEQLRVYVDGVPAGGPGMLRDMSTDLVASIRYMDGRAATERYGTDHGAGALLITMQR